MSTRVGLSRGAVVGALGDAWAQRCGRRLLLTCAGAERAALLLKSNDSPTAVARFKVRVGFLHSLKVACDTFGAQLAALWLQQ